MRNRVSLVLLLFLMAPMLWSGELVIVNKTAFPLFEVFFSPQESDDWGNDLIPYDVIMPDSHVTVRVEESPGRDLYKIRLLDEDGEIYVKYNLDLTVRRKILIQPMDLLVISPGEGLSFSLVNATGDTITGLYISPETQDSWGDNLVSGYLLNQAEMDVALPAGQEAAFYDIRFDMRENTYIQKHVFLSHRARIHLSLQ